MPEQIHWNDPESRTIDVRMTVLYNVLNTPGVCKKYERILNIARVLVFRCDRFVPGDNKDLILLYAFSECLLWSVDSFYPFLRSIFSCVYAVLVIRVICLSRFRGKWIFCVEVLYYIYCIHGCVCEIKFTVYEVHAT